MSIAYQSSSLIGGHETPEARTKLNFLECLRLIERLHRRMLDIVKHRLDAVGMNDINSVQALLIYNIGDHEMTAGDLRNRGYYLGSNVSYNLKKLVETGYIMQERSEHDRRALRIWLSDKGKAVCNLVGELFDENLDMIKERNLFEDEDVTELRNSLRNLESFWSDILRFQG
ncbi:MarR family winged helix-turn-helix transcriptional regulator [Emcibacter nanhaiensis]|uniref:Winged helix-turn-helix transcriptional regulator n=1 Tax=Emcibacter nanhaiensis TaxID=1505037 RepID=A0A501PSE1_9PROT|nr:MarR family winged helix-turn-helix transcriptional regulator [Emcibacter nanhaiensis]TPD62706.1 winged helix-turn-helix transcriptional regulator [Emcibacter nanhaiensis]